MRNIRNGDYMLRKLENEIVKECAPTLAGIKMANLFNYRFVSEDEFDSEIKTANMNLNEKGVYGLGASRGKPSGGSCAEMV